jgi:hypothetical protein
VENAISAKRSTAATVSHPVPKIVQPEACLFTEPSHDSCTVIATETADRCGPRDEIEIPKVIMKAQVRSVATVGAAEHGNSVVLVTLGSDHRLLDRRRVDLTRGLPTHPYHHEGSWAIGRYADSPWARNISLPDAIALVERVRDAAAHGAREALDALATSIAEPIASIALRVCPPLPPTTEERIRDTRAANVADSVMYREALAAAAEARGWRVGWYGRERVFRDAGLAIGDEDIDALLRALGRAAGPPWQAKHKLAAAAALALLPSRRTGSAERLDRQ